MPELIWTIASGGSFVSCSDTGTTNYTLSEGIDNAGWTAFKNFPLGHGIYHTVTLARAESLTYVKQVCQADYDMLFLVCYGGWKGQERSRDLDASLADEILREDSTALRIRDAIRLPSIFYPEDRNGYETREDLRVRAARTITEARKVYPAADDELEAAAFYIHQLKSFLCDAKSPRIGEMVAGVVDEVVSAALRDHAWKEAVLRAIVAARPREPDCP